MDRRPDVHFPVDDPRVLAPLRELGVFEMAPNGQVSRLREESS